MSIPLLESREIAPTLSRLSITPEDHPMNLELVSFNICPFVQRSLITLLHKKVEHKITYIDLADTPKWFNDISPLGKVPLLKVDDEVLFESAVINEYVDETTGVPIMPADPLSRAKNRAWIEFGSNLIGIQYRLCLAENEENFSELRTDYRNNIGIIEDQLKKRKSASTYFNGETLSLTDTAYAPLFMREEIVKSFQSLYSADEFPHYQAWSAALLALEEVRLSVQPEFEQQFLTYFRNKGTFAFQG